MGLTESTTESMIDGNDLMKYQSIRTEHDRRFGEIGIHKNKQTNELVWIKQIFIEDEATALRIKQHISTQEYMSNCFITIQWKMFDKPGSVVCGTCTSSRKLVVVLEYFERDLEGELMRRASELVFVVFVDFLGLLSWSGDLVYSGGCDEYGEDNGENGRCSWWSPLMQRVYQRGRGGEIRRFQCFWSNSEFLCSNSPKTGKMPNSSRTIAEH